MRELAYASLPKNEADTHQSKPNLNNLACFLNNQTINLNHTKEY